MDEGRLGRGESRMGEWLGDFEDLVGHTEGGRLIEGNPPVRKRWNPVTYRCAFCGESFVSRAMIRRHLERHGTLRATDESEREGAESQREGAAESQREGAESEREGDAARAAPDHHVRRAA